MKKKLIQLIAFTSALFFMIGCAKTVDCDISQKHVHVYTKDGKLNKLIDSEKESFGLYNRTDEYVLTDAQEKELIGFEYEQGLFRISENIDIINSIISSQTDRIEYRYFYMYLLPIAHTMKVGDSTIIYFTYIPMPGYSWTTNREHDSLTGEQRTVHTVYTACKIVIDAETGKRVVIESEAVDNFEDLPENFPYIKNDFYKEVDINYQEITYEDGPEEDHKLTEEQQKEYEEQQNKEGKISTLDLVL